jgi:DNA-binding IclR family transcriptional regulator
MQNTFVPALAGGHMTETEDEPDRDRVGTAQTVFEIVEQVRADTNPTLTDIAREVPYAKSTVFRHLQTLESLGLVVERSNGYQLGLRFLQLSQRACRSHPGYELAREKVAEIATETGERAQYIVEEHGEAVYLCRAVGARGVRTDPGIGSRIPLHSTAAGKAILAAMTAEQAAAILEEQPLAARTDATITDERRSLNREENVSGLNAVGVPVVVDDTVVGALSVSGPSHRLAGDRLTGELPDYLLGAANELELNVAYA